MSSLKQNVHFEEKMSRVNRCIAVDAQPKFQK